jgi:hypothetical protein
MTAAHLSCGRVANQMGAPALHYHARGSIPLGITAMPAMRSRSHQDSIRVSTSTTVGEKQPTREVQVEWKVDQEAKCAPTRIRSGYPCPLQWDSASPPCRCKWSKVGLEAAHCQDCLQRLRRSAATHLAPHLAHTWHPF